jgi:ribonuclease J
MAAENIFILGNGNVLEFENADTPIRMEQVEAGNILVDGLGVGDVGNIVLRDRRHLATDGLIIVVMATSSSTGKLLSGPDVISRGFVYMRESEDMISNIREVAYEAFNKNDDGGPRRRQDWNTKKAVVRDAIHSYVYEKTKRNPMILPIIVEINPDAHGYDEDSFTVFDEE